MKSGQLFWGFLLLCMGVLFLLVRYDVIINDFGFVWDIWPLIFILWGAKVIFKNEYIRPVINAVFGIFLGLMIFGVIHNIFASVEWSDYDYHRASRHEVYNQELDPNVTRAELDFKSGAGIFQINGGSNELIQGETYGNMADYDFTCDQTDDMAYIELRYQRTRFNLFKGKFRNRVDLNLSTVPVWDFKLNFGAAKAKFDFSDLKVKDIDINTGAANVWMKLGDKYSWTNVDVDMGVSGLKIEIPEDSGCRLYGDMVLISKNIRGLSKRQSGFYETENYDYAKNKIEIKIDGGVSSLSVDRY